MTIASSTQPIIRHIIGEGSLTGPQHCILCGATVSAHVLGTLPSGTVFERDGRLFLIEPDDAVISCQDR